MIESFSDFKINRQILNAVGDAGFVKPTDIQREAIPPLLSGQDLMGIAQTGTGKTAAYLIPLIMKIKYAQGNDARALILVPTRELCLQVADQAKQLAKYTDLRIHAIYGGVGLKTQLDTISNGIDILIATPARFMDLYLPGHIQSKKIEMMVMDEAERLLDMGFKPQINGILEVVPRKRQNILFSATMHERVINIANDFLDVPTVINITPEIKTAVTVSQSVYHVPNIQTKINLLMYLLKNEDFQRIIIFCKTKENANNVFKFLERKLEVDEVKVIHGNKGQNTRINAFNQFREGKIKILVTTDVVARGIDISDVSHVINFDVPLIYEDYIHRIGRTGRAERKGVSITFVNSSDEYHLKKIQKLIGQKIQVLEFPEQVMTESTPYEEKQKMLREIDAQRMKDDPEYQGAFHDKKPYRKKYGRSKK